MTQSRDLTAPYKVTAETKKAFIELLGNGHTITFAAKQCGVSRTTIYFHRQADEEFDKAIRVALDSRCQVVEDALYRRAVDGHVTAMIFWLCNREAARWRNVNQVSINQETHVHNNRVSIAELAREEMAKRNNLTMNAEDDSIGGNGHDRGT